MLRSFHELEFKLRQHVNLNQETNRTEDWQIVAVGTKLPVTGTGKCWCDDPECCRVVVTDRTSTFHFELLASVGLGALFFVFLSNGIVKPQELYAAWFMPFLGIAAATIAMSTPEEWSQ